MRRFVVLLTLAAVLVASCGGGDDEETPAATEQSDAADLPAEEMTVPQILTSGDFEQVCGGGTVSGATEYSKKPGVHPLIAFEGEDPEYDYTSMTLPEGWQSDLAAETTELVLCMDRVSEKKINTCEDYESDDRPEPFDVEVYAATYDVTLYAATTGEVIANGTVEGTDKECPFLVFFDEEEDVQREYADVSAHVRSFVKDYVSP